MEELAPDRAGHRDGRKLTEREYQVAELMALGLTNAAIGSSLTITSATVSSQVAHMLAKLGFRSRAQVAAWVVGRQLRRSVSSEARD